MAHPRLQGGTFRELRARILLGAAFPIIAGLALFLGRGALPTLSGGVGSSGSQPSAGGTATAQTSFPTLEDFWNGTAHWALDVPDTGLPVGESDTLYMGNGVFWSYLHASTQSAGITDSCGGTVAFPGCVTRWISTDGGQHFSLTAPTCLLNCRACPCAEEDLTRQQQYPRVARAETGEFFMVFEHDAQTYLTTSRDGLTWVRPAINNKTGLWHYSDGPCSPAMHIGPHPSFPNDYQCMAGGPPGIYLYGDRVFEFVGLGQDPGHMGCYFAWMNDLLDYYPCSANPLFSGAAQYGPLDVLGSAANPYFDFRFVTSADVVRVGDNYYMSYEGVRGPSSPAAGRDNQFGLGFARSPVISGPWQKYPGNPVLEDLADNWGVGHADLVIADGVTYMYTATPSLTRGRYVLVYNP